MADTLLCKQLNILLKHLEVVKFIFVFFSLTKISRMRLADLPISCGTNY